jgi:hypothetical protein
MLPINASSTNAAALDLVFGGGGRPGLPLHVLGILRTAHLEWHDVV